MNKVNLEAVSDLESKKSFVIQEIMKRQDEISEKAGGVDSGLVRDSIADASNMVDFLIEAVRDSDQSLFSEYCLWLSELFTNRGLPSSVILSLLESTRKFVIDLLAPHSSKIVAEYVTKAMEGLEDSESSSQLNRNDWISLNNLAQEYLGALLSGDRNSAVKMVLDAVENGISVQDIYIDVLQKTQYEIGRLWHENKVTVAQEHFCSAATQLVMSQLYPLIFRSERIGKSFVGASVGGELHEIGIRMVADFFEMEGWETYYMGANTPVSSLVETAITRQPEMIGISVTMPFHVKRVEEIVSRIRNSRIGDSVKILVGGYAMKRRPNLWRELGADGYAEDARQATVVAFEMVSLSKYQ